MRGQFVQVVRVEKIRQTNFTSFPTSDGCHLSNSVGRTPNLHSTKNVSAAAWSTDQSAHETIDSFLHNGAE